MADDVERRLEALEEALSRIEKQVAAQRDATARSRRNGVIVRIGVLVVLVAAYYFYFRYASRLG